MCTGSLVHQLLLDYFVYFLCSLFVILYALRSTTYNYIAGIAYSWGYMCDLNTIPMGNVSETIPHEVYTGANLDQFQLHY